MFTVKRPCALDRNLVVRVNDDEVKVIDGFGKCRAALTFDARVSCASLDGAVLFVETVDGSAYAYVAATGKFLWESHPDPPAAAFYRRAA